MNIKPLSISLFIHLMVLLGLSFVWLQVPKPIVTISSSNVLEIEYFQNTRHSSGFTTSEKVIPQHTESKIKELAPQKASQQNSAPVLGWKIHKPKPSYPYIARQNGWQGEVKIRVRTDRNGRVVFVKMEQSSGYPILDNSALDMVQKWRLAPNQERLTPIAFRIK